MQTKTHHACTAKPYLLPCQTLPFRRQNHTFCRAKRHVLQTPYNTWLFCLAQILPRRHAHTAKGRASSSWKHAPLAGSIRLSLLSTHSALSRMEMTTSPCAAFRNSQTFPPSRFISPSKKRAYSLSRPAPSSPWLRPNRSQT